jgi:hypothetical protein
MDFVVMCVTLQVRNSLLPVGGQNVFVLPREALVDLLQ